jgi:hypothetical protein
MDVYRVSVLALSVLTCLSRPGRAISALFGPRRRLGVGRGIDISPHPYRGARGQNKACTENLYITQPYLPC